MQLRSALSVAVVCAAAFMGCASVDGSGSSGALACGRYEVVEEGSPLASNADGKCPTMAPCDGSGLVTDTTTARAWVRFAFFPSAGTQTQAQADAYCVGKGAGWRLPTKDEALAITGASYCLRAWPNGWQTWTSGLDAAGKATVVSHLGYTVQLDPATSGTALCVR
jgi:hypothetical protein